MKNRDLPLSDDQSLPDRIVTAIRGVLGDEQYILHKPIFGGNEQKYLQDCIESTYVSSVGRYVDQFENGLCNFTGAKYAVAVVNGTSALHIALLLAGTKTDDEVIVPSLTFIATANAIKYCGAIPHFVDSEEETLGIDPLALRDWLAYITEMRNGFCFNKQSGRRIKVLLPMNTFGHPNKLDVLKNIADEFGLIMIEDAAESLGSYYNGQHTGTFGLAGTLSFNGNKTITTGGGGAILTDDFEIAKRAKHITTTAKKPHSWEYDHDEVGFNYRLPNLNAALGCAQLEQLPDILVSKRRLTEKYKGAFSSINELELILEPANCSSNYWLQAIKLDRAFMSERDAILQGTNDAGFMTRPVWNLIHTLKPYKGCPKADLSVAESLAKQLINLPSSAGIV
ncbi:LegC family aminotransferase [Lentilitoribacter sp. EG35]|uniref:LegC family aminotransferase n=1 Tax=Lentilitoribacter sp. EG35 TaxID=3234192 RepID=UPI00346092F7